MDKNNPVKVSEKLFGILEYLAQAGPSGLVEIADALNMNKSTAHRLLRSLRSLGYVCQDGKTGQYCLTSRILDVADLAVNKGDVHK